MPQTTFGVRRNIQRSAVLYMELWYWIIIIIISVKNRVLECRLNFIHVFLSMMMLHDSNLLRKDVRNKTSILGKTVIDNKSELSLIGVVF